MARGSGQGPSGNRLRRSGSAARRAWPMVLMAWERWQALPEADKERYRQRARSYAERGREAVVQARRRRGGGSSR
jgi:hypothetical protein